MHDEFENQVDGQVFLADHAIEKMIERNISPRDLADALARPDQTYLRGTRRLPVLVLCSDEPVATRQTQED